MSPLFPVLSKDLDNISEFSVKNENILYKTNEEIDNQKIIYGASNSKFPLTTIEQKPNKFPIHCTDDVLKIEYKKSCQQRIVFEAKEKQIQYEHILEKKRKLIYKKGYPFQKIDKKWYIPRFIYLENFNKNILHNWNKEMVMEKIYQNKWNNPQADELCYELLSDTIEYSSNQKFVNKQKVALLEIIYRMFQHLMIHVCLNKTEFYKFFKEFLLLYTVDDPPDSLKIFSINECLMIARKFEQNFEYSLDLLQAILKNNFQITINMI